MEIPDNPAFASYTIHLDCRQNSTPLKKSFNDDCRKNSSPFSMNDFHIAKPFEKACNHFTYHLFPGSLAGLFWRCYGKFPPSCFFGRGGLMQCIRCRSALVFEVYYGPGVKFPEWRCIVCGSVLDASILANRLHHTRPGKRLLFQSQVKLWMDSQGQNRSSVKAVLPVVEPWGD